MSDSGLVLVTGATGFLATHCIKLLQEHGWKVRGTVRNLKDEKRTSALYNLVPDAKHKLELVEADLTKPETWPEAVKGCKYVLHVASPFPGAGGKVSDVENQLMRPAIDGTLNVLRACAKSGSVKRVVVTSSVAAIFSDTKHKNGEKKYNEEDWTDIDDPHCDKYCVSKTRAEQEAWKFVKELPEGEKFELCTVCPSFIYGPLLTKNHSEATSLEPLVLLMNRDLRLVGGVPHYMFPICDARDVAEAHLKAMLSPEAPGQRFIVHSESVWFIDMCSMLSKHFGQYGYKFPFLEIPTIFSWFARFLDSNVKHYMYPRLGLKTDYDNSKMQKVLGLTPRKGEDIVVDMARSLVDMGYARKLRGFPEEGEQKEGKERKRRRRKKRVSAGVWLSRVVRRDMIRYMQMGFRGFWQFLTKIWNLLVFIVKKEARTIVQHQAVRYDLYPLSPLTQHRLSLVKRKVLVLDLDETLIHSHHDGVIRQTVKPGTPPDFSLRVVIDRHPVRFFVHKRPHVDYFLDIVQNWFELVVFTASMEIYGAAVSDKLDNKRGILRRRYYRQHCTLDFGSYTKDLSAICADLSSVFILDNSPGAYRGYPDNAVPIKSWFSDPHDTALLNLLPVLDALRFCQDVRSVLGRNLHLHRLW